MKHNLLLIVLTPSQLSPGIRCECIKFSSFIHVEISHFRRTSLITFSNYILLKSQIWIRFPSTFGYYFLVRSNCYVSRFCSLCGYSIETRRFSGDWKSLIDQIGLLCEEQMVRSFSSYERLHVLATVSNTRVFKCHPSTVTFSLCCKVIGPFLYGSHPLSLPRLKREVV